MKNWLNNNLLKVIAIVMVFGALFSSFGKLFILPFAYYQLMNWAVVGAAAIIAWEGHKTKKPCLIWLSGLIAVIFNPINPIYLSQLGWQISNAVAIIFFLISFFIGKKK